MKRAKRNFARRVRNNFCINASSALSVFSLLSLWLCINISVRQSAFNVFKCMEKEAGSAHDAEYKSLCICLLTRSLTQAKVTAGSSPAINLAACCEELPRAGRDPAFFLTPDMYGVLRALISLSSRLKCNACCFFAAAADGARVSEIKWRVEN
jgi:hypothetical protein